MSVNLAYRSTVTSTETLETNVPSAPTANSVVTHSLFNTSLNLTDSTTPPVTETASFEQALTAGAATIDLEALLGTAGKTVVGTGLRVQVLKFKNKSASTTAMTIRSGAANGYDGFGSGLIGLSIEPGAEVLIFTNDAGANISPTNSDIDIAGAGVEVCEVTIVLG